MKSMQEALTKKGFSFIEIVSQCPENYGRRIGLKTGVEFLRRFKEQAIPIEKARQLTEEKLEGRIIIGKLIDRERPEFVTELHRLTREQVDKIKAEQESVS